MRPPRRARRPPRRRLAPVAMNRGSGAGPTSVTGVLTSSSSARSSMWRWSDTLAPEGQAGTSSVPTQTTACRPKRASGGRRRRRSRIARSGSAARNQATRVGMARRRFAAPSDEGRQRRVRRPRPSPVTPIGPVGSHRSERVWVAAPGALKVPSCEHPVRLVRSRAMRAGRTQQVAGAAWRGRADARSRWVPAEQPGAARRRQNSARWARSLSAAVTVGRRAPTS